MTDINHRHFLQNDIIPEEQEVNTFEPEEGDITEAVPNIVHVSRKPSLPHMHQQERLHNNGDSESEEDLTEEHVDTNLILATNLENLNIENTSPPPALENTSSTESSSIGQTQQQQRTENSNEEGYENNGSNAGTLQLPEENAQQQQQQPEITAPVYPTATNNSNSSSSRGRSISSVSPSTVTGLLPRSQRVWEMDRQAPECRRCHRRFNFLVRRHHCRRCGQIVCDKCSSNRIRLPVEELIEDPMVSTSQYPLLASQSQRVCDTCYREPIRRSSESHSRRLRTSRPVPFGGSQMRRTDSSQSLMIDCPVCGNTFLGMPKNEQEEHLQRCLNVGSPPVQSPRYIVYELSQDSTQIGDECPICFDEFEEGDKVSRMICLCSYHQRCLADWLQRGKGCPVHYDSLQG